MPSASPLALIAGAGPGIGSAAALRFLRGGCRVAALARPGEALETLRGTMPDTCVVAVDIADRQALAGALGQVRETMGFPEILLWNASCGLPGGLLDRTGGELAADLEANLLAPLDAVRWALPAMRASGRGRILVTGGGLALAPEASLASSSLGKAVQRHLALLLDAELEGSGVRAATLTVCGFVQPGTAFSPEAVAEALWELHTQAPEAWERERVLRVQ